MRTTIVPMGKKQSSGQEMPRHFSNALSNRMALHLQLPARDTGNQKPSCSYHCMIGMALAASPNGKLPVNEIYKFILNNFSYFRTAADNWKNSVRHCLSLGQCFHKVMLPGALPYKKGFNWEVVPGKLVLVHQEIVKYLALTGRTAESFGIQTTKLISGIQTPPMTLPFAIQHSTNAQHQTSNIDSSITMCTVSPSLGFVKLQLSPKDLEVLQNIGQPLTPSLSPYDYNLLTNPNMQQELSSIVHLIKDESNLDSQQRNCQLENKSPNSHVTEISSPEFSTSQCGSIASVSSTPAGSFPYSDPRTNIVKPLQTDMPGSSNFTASVSGSWEVGNDKPNHSEGSNCKWSQQRQGLDITYSPYSPTNFTTKYPTNPMDLIIEEEVTTEDHDTSYPFICPELENDLDVSLNELNTSTDWEDLEEPLVLSSKKEVDCLEIDIEPVETDWNCWKEPSYLHRINILVNSINTHTSLTVEELCNATHCSNESVRVCSKASICSTENVRGSYKMKNNSSMGDNSDSWKKRSDCSMKGTEDDRKKRYSKSRSTCQPSINTLIVSIPFTKLITNRQAKKYCCK